MNIEQFQTELKKMNIELSDQQLEQFETYYKLLVEWNEKINLTAIVEREEVYLKHFYDSLTPAKYFSFQENISICDVGAGAGFRAFRSKLPFHIYM